MIPTKLRKILTDDERMNKCEICGVQQVEWHHVFLYAGAQINEYFNIAPACKRHHDIATPHNNKYQEKVREQFEWNALQRMTTQDLAKYSKKDWGTLTWYLSKKAIEYGW